MHLIPPGRQPSGYSWPFRILCIDDQPDVADSTAELLRLVGFDVRVCYDGKSALAAAAAFQPCLCLIDLNMPGMDGDVLAVELRCQAGRRPLLLVAVTAMGDERSCRRIADAGFDLHLVKPVEPVGLLNTVNRLQGAWQKTLAQLPR